MTAGATAINAGLPFRRVLMTLHNVLRAGPVTATQRAAQAVHLGRRAEEMSRFGDLTGASVRPWRPW